MSSDSKKFVSFLKKLPQLDRWFYLTMRMYERTCEELGSTSELVEAHIIETYLSNSSPEEFVESVHRITDHSVKPQEPSILSAIEKLDREFDQKLGKWVDSDSDSSSCSCCESECNVSGKTE